MLLFNLLLAFNRHKVIKVSFTKDYNENYFLCLSFMQILVIKSPFFSVDNIKCQTYKKWPTNSLSMQYWQWTFLLRLEIKVQTCCCLPFFQPSKRAAFGRFRQLYNTERILGYSEPKKVSGVYHYIMLIISSKWRTKYRSSAGFACLGLIFFFSYPRLLWSMSWLFGSSKSPKSQLPPTTALQQQRLKQIESLRTFHK